MAKRGKITRKTELLALEPQTAFHVDRQFIAPYGRPIAPSTMRRIEHDDPGSIVELADMAGIDHVGEVNNERHSRMMRRDYLFPHERRVNGITWDVDEAIEWDRQVEEHNLQQEINAIRARNMAEFGWLNAYFKNPATRDKDTLTIQEALAQGSFRTMEFDDPEIIPESTSNQHSPIFTSTGRTFKAKERRKDNTDPSLNPAYAGDLGERKELPTWAYSQSHGNSGNSIVITVNGREYRHIKGELLPENISKVLVSRYMENGCSIEQAANMLIKDYY